MRGLAPGPERLAVRPRCARILYCAVLIGFGLPPAMAHPISLSWVELTVAPEQMQLVTADGRRLLEPGVFELTVGGASPGDRGVALGAPQPVRGRFTLR